MLIFDLWGSSVCRGTRRLLAIVTLQAKSNRILKIQDWWRRQKERVTALGVGSGSKRDRERCKSASDALTFSNILIWFYIFMRAKIRINVETTKGKLVLILFEYEFLGESQVCGWRGWIKWLEPNHELARANRWFGSRPPILALVFASPLLRVPKRNIAPREP